MRRYKEYYIMKVYENLANAIIERAAEDYKAALREKKAIDAEINSIERFFYSQYFESLTEVDGPYLMMKIREAVEVEQKPKTQKN